MATKIEWTDETWNPVTGCTKVSQGCKNCYAERIWPKVEAAERQREHWEWMKAPKRAFTDVRTHPNRLDAPLHWRKPRRIFVNSMSDLFHEDVPVLFIASVLGIAAAADWHTFQVLTKRPQRMLDVLSSSKFDVAFEDSNDMHAHTEHTWPPANIWLGVSVEDQATADERIPLLLQTPAARHFLSCEPLLGPIEITDSMDHECGDPPHGLCPSEIDWVIAGGESGPGARPSHPDWFRSLRDQCAAAAVPFFFKQWGQFIPHSCAPFDQQGAHTAMTLGRKGVKVNGDLYWSVGKKAAGRMLDGREHMGVASMRRGPTLKTLQRQCDEFNAAVKVGDPVDYESIKGDGKWQRYRTREKAEILSGHTAVVWLEGKSGCVAVDHCRPVS